MRQKKAQLNIQKVLLYFVAVTMLFSGATVVHADDVASGICGDNLSWSLSGGTLTVTGTGAMYDYLDTALSPWYPVRDQITRLEFSEGITSIGGLAFYDCYRLTAVEIPDSVTSIGAYAFASCERIALLDLGDGLKTLAESVFHGCRALTAVRFPQSLESIGNEAFYDCSALTAITIPASVNHIGAAAFAYCTSLIRAELSNPISSLPEWIFFGCSQLSTVILPETVQSMGHSAFRDCSSLSYVSYGGEAMSKEEMSEAISKDVPTFELGGSITQDVPADTSHSSVVTETPDGTVIVENTTVTELGSATVSTSTQLIVGGTDSTSVKITVTVEDDAGWEEAADVIQNAMETIEEQTVSADVGSTDITLYVKDTESVDQVFMDSLVGQDVQVTVVTKDGSSWKIDCEELDTRQEVGPVDLRYQLYGASDEICTQMSSSRGYLLKFAANAAVNAELKIQLPQELARQTATLFHQENRRTLVLHQSVIIDADGCAHFYLGEVSNEVDYFIGINVPGTQEEAIIPDSLQEEYGIDYAEPIQYVITGRKSSWGIGIGTVTWILAAVMIGTIAGVGVVMYTLNKRKLKKGYIPDISEEE